MLNSLFFPSAKDMLYIYIYIHFHMLQFNVHISIVTYSDILLRGNINLTYLYLSPNEFPLFSIPIIDISSYE